MSLLGYKRKFRGVGQHFRFTPDSRHSRRHVRFRADYVCSALNSGRKWARRWTSACDPQRKFAKLGRWYLPPRLTGCGARFRFRHELENQIVECSCSKAPGQFVRRGEVAAWPRSLCTDNLGAPQQHKKSPSQSRGGGAYLARLEGPPDKLGYVPARSGAPGLSGRCAPCTAVLAKWKPGRSRG
jgi:hypothetical protein